MIKIKLNVDLLGFKAGRVIKLDVCSDGNPVDAFWRRRVRDCEVDGCVEVLKDENKKSKKKEVSE